MLEGAKYLRQGFLTRCGVCRLRSWRDVNFCCPCRHSRSVENGQYYKCFTTICLCLSDRHYHNRYEPITDKMQKKCRQEGTRNLIGSGNRAAVREERHVARSPCALNLNKCLRSASQCTLVFPTVRRPVFIYDANQKTGIVFPWSAKPRARNQSPIPPVNRSSAIN